jgi:anaerobic selenocysteine-containing dehydrogenase
MHTVVPVTHVRESRDSIVDIRGGRTPHQGDWPVRVDERLIEEPDHWIQSTCVLCSTGCAVDLGVKDNRLVGIRGRAVDRVNKGRLGPKGLHGWVGRVDLDWIGAHTVGYHDLEHTVSSYTPERVSRLTNVPVRQLKEAAEILGESDTLVSTVRQGVYQSNQATASAVQVNNLHLIRGLIGKPGSTVFQMNGQPTAQNTRVRGERRIGGVS